jgi:hypothetical protein
MGFVKKEQMLRAVRILRDDKTRLHFGLVLMVAGLVLFGVYYPRIRVQSPSEIASQQADGTGAAQVAGVNAGGENKDGYQRAHAGAPEQGQHVASVPGSDPAACAAGTSSGKTSAPAGFSGTIDVALPAGCKTSGTYELRTSDGREVTWNVLYGAFEFSDGSSFNRHGETAYAVTKLSFGVNGTTGSSVRYGVAIKPDAKPGIYENALYISDPQRKDTSTKVILRITVKK